MAGNGQVGLTWTAAATGPTPTSYTVYTYLNGVVQAPLSTGSAVTNYTVTGLTNGAMYSFVVVGATSSGFGAPSGESNGAVPDAVPLAPGAPAASISAGTITVNWTAPSPNGGTPIQQYVVTPSVGGHAQPQILTASTQTSFVESPVNNGATYSFVVAARNRAGTGAASSSSNSVTPSAATSCANFTAVAAGNSHSLALNTDGSVWAWGNNSVGQLGDNATYAYFYPTPAQMLGPGAVGVLSGIKQIAAGAFHSLALKWDGTVWAGGYNHYGQVGNGTTNYNWTPSQVVGPSGQEYLTSIVAIAGGENSSYALKADGTVWSWGIAGNLGNGTNTASSVPVEVVTSSGPLTGITAIAQRLLPHSRPRLQWQCLGMGLQPNGQLGQGTSSSSSNVAIRVLGSGGVGLLASITAIAGETITALRSGRMALSGPGAGTSGASLATARGNSWLQGESCRGLGIFRQRRIVWDRQHQGWR